MPSEVALDEKKELGEGGSPEAEEVKKRGFSRVPWRKIGRAALFVFATLIVAGLGYLAVWAWQRYLPFSSEPESLLTESWQVYKSETYGLGLRYPTDWEATEVKPELIVFKPQSVEGEEGPSEYMDLAVESNENRGITACEEDQIKCSFHTNGIFGERIATPEAEIVFFSHGDNDFTVTLYKYDQTDLLAIFEEMVDSLRFVTGSSEEDVTPNP